LNQWRTISIPTTQLNPNNYPINFVTIQNYTGSEKTFYTDEVTFHAKSQTTVLYQTEIPENFSLKQNYPNPFNPNTAIEYELPTTSYVLLKVYNVLGKLMTTLVDEIQSPGIKTTRWQAIDNTGNPFPSGIYFYRIESTNINNPSEVYLDYRKMTLLK
jgi:hypothetical protein